MKNASKIWKHLCPWNNSVIQHTWGRKVCQPAVHSLPSFPPHRNCWFDMLVFPNEQCLLYFLCQSRELCPTEHCPLQETETDFCLSSLKLSLTSGNEPIDKTILFLKNMWEWNCEKKMYACMRKKCPWMFLRCKLFYFLHRSCPLSPIPWKPPLALCLLGLPRRDLSPVSIILAHCCQVWPVALDFLLFSWAGTQITSNLWSGTTFHARMVRQGCERQEKLGQDWEGEAE